MKKEENVYIHLASYYFPLTLGSTQGLKACDKMLLSTLCQTGRKKQKGEKKKNQRRSASKNP